MGGKAWCISEVQILIDYKNRPVKEYLHLLPKRNRKTIVVKRIELGIAYNCKELNAVCDFCGKKYHVANYKFKVNKNMFCSRKCCGNWKKENYKGEKGPFYGRKVTPEMIEKANESRRKTYELNPRKRKWNNNKLKLIIYFMKKGLSYYEIAEKFNVNKTTIISITRLYNLQKYYKAKYKHNSEGHIKLRKLLHNLFSFNKFKNEKYIKKIKQYIDIYDLTLNIAYEYNGIQHYIQKSTWNRKDEDFTLQQERDKRKYEWCKNNNIPLIIVRYNEELNQELIISKLKEQGINYEGVKNSSSFLFDQY